MVIVVCDISSKNAAVGIEFKVVYVRMRCKGDRNLSQCFIHFQKYLNIWKRKQLPHILLQAYTFICNKMHETENTV